MFTFLYSVLPSCPLFNFWPYQIGPRVYWMSAPALIVAQVTVTVPLPVLHSLHLWSLPVGLPLHTTSILPKQPAQTGPPTQPVKTVSASHLAYPCTRASQSTFANTWSLLKIPTTRLHTPQHLTLHPSPQQAIQALTEPCAQPQAERLREQTHYWMSLPLRSCAPCPNCCLQRQLQP